mmetsp:Transcript_25985/g.32037  ORF Transcript_25985/g.32037 Transcript_25985/m.32037 type:complete len:95 (+) Transcript_25985:413-697(+)
MKIKEGKKTLKRILKRFDCCVILHNILIDTESEYENDQWLKDDDNASETSGIGATRGIGETQGESDYSRPISEEDNNDERRNRLLLLLAENGAI